ncbi:MAG: TRAP transporter permease [Oscillospiraceae bacterium]|nr:TRAP transporter permease [Oscillospiraceae bacterium]
MEDQSEKDLKQEPQCPAEDSAKVLVDSQNEDPEKSTAPNTHEVSINEEISEEERNRIMAQYDKDSGTRNFTGVPEQIMRWLCVAFAVFMIGITIFWRQPPQIHRAAFVGFVTLLTFLLFPANKKNNIKVNYIPWYDLTLAAIAVICFLYYVINFDTIARQMAFFTFENRIFAIVGICVLFIASKRVVGLPLMIVVAAFVAYAYFGVHIPGRFGHAGFSVHRISTFLFYDLEGILGTPIGAASTFIFMFLLFGAFMRLTGIGAFFIELANAIAGKATGGPAKVAVIASSLQATICGSSVANTVASGTFTIPMMKRMGYNKNFAGAVEASSSTGGQLLPPIMGAAAFLMAEITGIPYAQIALAALIPALLYFACIFATVHFESKKNNLKGLPPEMVPKALPLFLKKGHLLLGIASIVFFLSQGFTPTMSASLGIVVSIVVSMIRKDTRLTPKKFFEALELGARNTVGVGVACAMAGIVVGVVTMTGLGMTFANSMLSLAAGIQHETFRLLAVLFFTMIASLILGMGVPTTAKYVIMATVTAPVVVRLLMDTGSLEQMHAILIAHMFVFYFGTDADITPPVGLASYAAAAISKGSPIRTSAQAMRLAAAAYFIPFIFVFSPQMLFINPNFFEILYISISGIIGIIGVSAGLIGFLVSRMSWWERILSIGAGLMMVDPGWQTTLIGIAILVGLFLLQKQRTQRPKALA